MALVPNIRTILSNVGALFADGVQEYRTLTSAPNATPRVYSAWIVIPYSRVIEQVDRQVQDEASGHWYLEETCQLRVPYHVGIVLSIRDQIRSGPTAGASANNGVWSIHNTIDSADGSVKAYNLYRRTPLLANPRPGGV